MRAISHGNVYDIRRFFMYMGIAVNMPAGNQKASILKRL